MRLVAALYTPPGIASSTVAPSQGVENGDKSDDFPCLPTVDGLREHFKNII